MTKYCGAGKSDRRAIGRWMVPGKSLRTNWKAGERASRDEKADDMDQALQLAQEIARLRREGSKQLEKENEELKEQIRQERAAGPGSVETAGDDVRVKVSWKAAAGTVDPDRVKSLFQRFGHIQDFIVSSKLSSALIVYEDSESIVKATTKCIDIRLHN